MTEQPKSDVQLCCEALAAAQQVWLEHEQSQRATSSGEPSEVEQLRQRVVELETERDRGCVFVALAHGLVNPMDVRRYLKDGGNVSQVWEMEYEVARHGLALIEKGGKQK